MTRDEVLALARDCLHRGGADYSELEMNVLARELLAMHEELERLGWSAMKLECKGDELFVEVQSLRADAYQMRSELERLKHTDVAQGRRIADLLAAQQADDMVHRQQLAELQSMRAVVEAAEAWRDTSGDRDGAIALDNLGERVDELRAARKEGK